MRRLEREQKQKQLEKAKPGLGNKYAKEKAMKDLERQSKSGNKVKVIQVRGHTDN